MSGGGGPRIATRDGYELAEGPVWDDRRELLFWVDIDRGLVMAGGLAADGTIRVQESWQFDGPVGAMAPGASGGDVVCVGGQVLYRACDGGLSVLTDIDRIAAAPGRRINDAKPDPRGRLVVGTLGGEQVEGGEVLARLESDGTLTSIDDDLTLSNGLAWSADGAIMYSVDTLRRVVYRRSYEDLGPREVHIEIPTGYPDGICMDSQQHLWVAVWGAGEVHRYDPEGRLVRVVDVPAPHTSSVAFAGPGLETLVITTARADLSPEQLARWPYSGRLFTLDAGVRGVAQPLWSGTLESEATRR